jgi:pimeloyl-ACP methyl ester carboxylesterase
VSLPLACKEFGDGDPLVVLHGLFGSAGNWTTVARRLGASRRVYALDLRNHGESPWHDGMAYEAMAADVLAFLDARGLGRAAVIGHSMGGKVAMALALAHPARVGALIVVDVAPVDYPPALAPFVAAMRALDPAAAPRRAEADARLAPAVPDPAIRAFLLQNLVKRDGRLAWRINLAAVEAEMDRISSFPDGLLERRYPGPTLFLGGGRSDYIRAEHDARIRRLFPAARIEHVPGAGHWVHAEAPDAFVREVEGFLDGAAARDAVAT